MKKYDAIMIGFGKGAKTLAAEFAKQGKKVAMIEKSSKMYGGTCINEGCIPSKSLIVQAGKRTFSDAIDKKEEITSILRKKNFEKLNQNPNIDVITAKASFVNTHVISYENEKGTKEIYGDYLFVNTGSVPIIPNIQGIEHTKHIYVSADIMKEKEQPKTLAIIGGGYIGLEFSSMFARYGTQVTVFEYGDRLVKREDEDIALHIQQILERQGVQFEFKSNVLSVENVNDSDVIVTYKNKDGNIQQLTVNAVLLATGRKANTDGLHLEQAGVETDARGAIKVNRYLQTSQPHIYAMGDVKGGLQFTYISLDDYRIVKDHIFGDKKRTTDNRGAIPYSVFIEPTFSRVGMSEEEAKNEGYEIKVAKLAVSAIPRAHVNECKEGVLKAIADAKTDKILGCVLLCTASEEMINFVQLAINLGLKTSDIANHIFTHPTMSEALNDLFGNF